MRSATAHTPTSNKAMRATAVMLCMALSSAFSTHHSRGVVRRDRLWPTTTTPHTPHRTHSLSTSPTVGFLQFRNGDEDYDPATQSRTGEPAGAGAAGHRWWQSIPLLSTSPTAAVDDETQRVEEYLRFLDKRYHQIHSSEEEEAPRPSSATTVGTSSNNNAEVQAQSSFLRPLNFGDLEVRGNNNALFALRWAARASEQHTAASVPKAPVVVETEETESQQDQSPKTLETAVVTLEERIRNSPVYQRIVSSRKALLRLEAVKARQVFRALVKAFGQIYKIPAVLLRWSGGRKPLAVALAATSVVLFHVLLPVVSTLIKEMASKAQ